MEVQLLIVHICPKCVIGYSALYGISSQVQVTGSQGSDEDLSMGLSSSRLPPFLQQLHCRLIEFCGMAFGDGVQRHFTQTQFATESTPLHSQSFGDHLCCNAEFGWQGEEGKLNDTNKQTGSNGISKDVKQRTT